MGTIAEKSDYLIETKELIKESINNLGGSITSETTFREYAEELDTIYSSLPKVTGENTEVILTPTLKGKLGIVEKGNSTQESTNGYQLLDTSKITTFTPTSASWYDFEGNSLSSASQLTENSLTYQMTSGQTYTFTIYDWANTGKVQILKVANGSFTQVVAELTSKTSSTFTASDNGVICFRCNTTTANVSTYVKCMLEKGSTPHTWEQYTNGPAPNPSYPFPIKSVTGNNNVVVAENLIGTLEQGTLSGSDGSTSDSSARVRTKDFIEVTAQTKYYLNCDNSNLYKSRVFCYKADGTYLSTIGGFDSWQYDFTTPNNCAKIKIIFAYLTNATMTPSNISNVICYIPNQTLPLNLGTIELNKIGNYQDYIYKNNDKWYKHEEIGKTIFNGTETWNRVETGYSEIANRANITITDLPTHTANYIEFYSNCFYGSLNAMTLTTVKAGEMCQYRNTQTVYFGIPVTITSVNELNTWLSTHNVDFYYIKATETDIEITDTQLIEQLENIDKMQGYNGTTIITSTFDENNAQMILQVSGLKGE